MRQEPANRKTFVVGALIGGIAATPWPFGRFHVSDEAVAVRGWFKERACVKSEIIDISLERFGPNYQLLFVDASGKMADVAVLLTMRVKGVVGELLRRGYPVVDRRGPLLSWRDSDSAERTREPPQASE